MSAMTLSVLGRAMLLAGCTAAGFYLAGQAADGRNCCWPLPFWERSVPGLPFACSRRGS